MGASLLLDRSRFTFLHGHLPKLLLEFESLTSGGAVALEKSAEVAQ